MNDTVLERSPDKAVKAERIRKAREWGEEHGYFQIGAWIYFRSYIISPGTRDAKKYKRGYYPLYHSWEDLYCFSHHNIEAWHANWKRIKDEQAADDSRRSA